MWRIVIQMMLVSLIGCWQRGYTQHTDTPHAGHREVPPGRMKPDTTVTNLRQIFSKGKFGGHARSYVMSTLNYGELKDHAAWGVGGAIYYRTAIFHGFQVGLSGIFTFNLASTDITERDSITGQLPKWELQLFDYERPDNRHDLDRLEEFYLKYYWRNSFAKLGRQGLHTPLVNEQDTRMKPYVFEGLWLEFAEVSNVRLNAGWFYRASPRSTTEWYSIRESMGIYSTGRNPDGTPSDYEHHVRTEGLGMAGLTWQPGSKLRLQLWNYFIENVQNTVFFQADFQPRQGDTKLLFGAQYLRQDPVHHGGNPDPEKTYYSVDEHANLFTLRAGLERGPWQTTLNYIHIAATGRFVFPREWGREQFFSTISRGRLEGLGGVNSVVATVVYRPPRIPDLSLALILGRTYTPSPGQYRLNKYGTSSYDQLNVDITCHFHRLLEGLHMRFLYVTKYNHEGGTDDLSRLYYASHVHHFNLIMNIDF